MRILFATSEVYPFSKTGGLADVAGALPAALVAQGHEVLVVSPWYAGLSSGAPLWIGDVEVPFEDGNSAVGVGTLERDGVRYAFVGHPDFSRERLYGYDDDVRRFCRFTRAVPQVSERVGFAPHVLHCNDWHTGYLPMLLAHGWHLPPGFPGMPTVFTVHNVQYQGHSGLDETLWWLRLPGALRDSHMNYFGGANAMQAALGYAHRVTTVSPTYAEEIGQPQYGYGLDGTFRHIAGKLVGILNGLDTTVWDPASDEHLPRRYDATTPAGKEASKQELCRTHDLDPSKPLLGVVSRLAEQKGIDILLAAADGLLERGWSLLVLGTGEPALEQGMRRLAESRRDASAVIGYDEGHAHLIYAGSDALAIPSRFEPCGLSQMIAMRYGTLPIARATGGLRDTIEHHRTGFLFESLDATGLVRAADEALSVWRTPAWSEMMHEGMTRDFSWSSSARRYSDVYREAREAA